jgi:hypothetical protein
MKPKRVRHTAERQSGTVVTAGLVVGTVRGVVSQTLHPTVFGDSVQWSIKHNKDGLLQGDIE